MIFLCLLLKHRNLKSFVDASPEINEILNPTGSFLHMSEDIEANSMELSDDIDEEQNYAEDEEINDESIEDSEAEEIKEDPETDSASVAEESTKAVERMVSVGFETEQHIDSPELLSRRAIFFKETSDSDLSYSLNKKKSVSFSSRAPDNRYYDELVDGARKILTQSNEGLYPKQVHLSQEPDVKGEEMTALQPAVLRRPATPGCNETKRIDRETRMALREPLNEKQARDAWKDLPALQVHWTKQKKWKVSIPIKS